MATSNERVRTETTYEFDLEHADIVGMMNDPQVLLEGGNVDGEQVFQLVLRKETGGEIVLKDLNPTDTLVIRYSKVVTEDNETVLGSIDVTED